MVSVEQMLKNIEKFAEYNAFISTLKPEAGKIAVAVKDNVDVAGTVTTAGGRHLSPDPVAEDAPIIASLRKAGVDFIGKANMHEYAFGVTTHNVHYGVCHNSHDFERVPGGSSGGSAVAVSLEMCDWAIGTDTGGSTRIPAGLCGVVGVKPTTGLLSIDGIFPLAATLDAPGPIARDVRTAAQALELLAEKTPGTYDPGEPYDWSPRLAVPEGWEVDMDEETQRVWSEATKDLPRIPFPTWKSIEDAFQPILFSEATSYHLDWLEKNPELYSDDVRKTLELGFKVKGAGYLWGLAQKDRLTREVDEAMGTYDAILIPNTSIVAPKTTDSNVREKLLRFTRPFNLTGHPVVTIPAPTEGLPVGVQVLGRRNGEREMFKVAAALEARWGKGKRPAVLGD